MICKTYYVISVFPATNQRFEGADHNPDPAAAPAAISECQHAIRGIKFEFVLKSKNAQSVVKLLNKNLADPNSPLFGGSSSVNGTNNATNGSNASGVRRGGGLLGGLEMNEKPEGAPRPPRGS